jgi:hypothetical protein
MTTEKNVHQRFWSKVLQAGRNACWIWQGATTGGDPAHGKGHGRFRFKGQLVMAHHMAWMLAGNELPPGKYLLHKCDNPLCVNVRHLYAGTILDNTKDMRERGRERFSHPGEKNTEATITAADVIKILDLYYKEGYSQQAIADHFSLNQGHVSRIILRKNWAHLPYNLPSRPIKRRIGVPIPH